MERDLYILMFNYLFEKWARSSAWTEHRVADPKDGGSNPPGPVKDSKMF